MGAGRHVLRVLVLMALLMVTTGRVGSAQEGPQIAPVVVDDSESYPADSLFKTLGPVPFEVAARVAAGRASRLDALAASNITLWVVLDMPTRLDDVERWRQSLQSLLGRISSHVTAVEIDAAEQPADLAAFAIRLASTEVRALTSARVALGGERMRTPLSRAVIYTPELAPYVDLVVVPAEQAEEAGAFLARVDPGARVAAVLAERAADSTAPASVMSSLLRFAGGDVQTAILPDAVASSTLSALAALPMLTSPTVAALDDTGSDLKISGDLPAPPPHRLLFDNRTFGTYLALPDGNSFPLDIAVRLTADPKPVIHDLRSRQSRSAEGASWDPQTRMLRLSLPAASGPLLIDFNQDAAAVTGDRTEVVGRRGLSIEEIIARHQAVQRRQDVRVQSYIAQVETAQHFRPTVADPGYDVVTENRYFVADDGIEWEELSFAVNGTRWGADRPPFPLLQAEKVLSLPLELRFSAGYRYRLDGEARVDDYDCYVVRFEPARADVPLYRGTVWIDRRSFARVRVQAVQAGLAAPVVSNEEIQDYAPPVMVGDMPVFLLTTLTSRQIMLIAGRNLLVEKEVRFRDIRVNDPRFDLERAAARSSDRIMLRETDAGLRYYLKQNGERVVSEHPTDKAKALAMGVYVDPSYSFPLPILGINYLDFAFGGPNSQFALLFGGVLAAGNIQRSNVGGTPLDVSVDFFGIAVPSSDRIYTADGEAEGERLLTWPLSTGLNIGWQYTPFQKATAQYQFRFDGYARDSMTAADFTLPASTVTNGAGVAWEYRRGGYVLTANVTDYLRASWHPWGSGAGASGPVEGTSYVRYQMNLSRDWYFGPFQKLHVNGAYFSGRDLDRFSKYQFGMFDDTRVHGVPSSGIRYEELGMLRGSYTFNLFDIYRLDLFGEQAWGHDQPNNWEPMTGLGAAVNLRGPKSTILRADFGKSFLPDRFRSVGSYTLQILVLKPLK